MKDGKWKKLLATTLGVGMAAALSLGVFTACSKNDDADTDEETDTPAAKTDTQLIKNGDFEFYSESTKDKDELRAILNTPSSWSFTSGSPSSDTKSGLINVGDDYWDYFTKEGYTFGSVADAYAHWKDENVTVYDRLKFYEDFDEEIDALDSSSAEKKLFDEYNYSVDYEDVQYLREELGEKVALHDDAKQREDGNTGILMIHNRRTSDNVLGTAQSYSSSTTITLQAGTSAEVSVWVKTARLEHYYAATGDDKNVSVSQRAGAYIGVTHTVGGTTLDQMQIKNINTAVTNAGGDNNGWEKYTVYLRANTFATSTFRIVLGLGMGSSDNRYEAVNGYALFDDLTCKIIDNETYETEAGKTGVQGFVYNDKGDDKKFDATENRSVRTFALDMYAPFDHADGENLFFKGFTEEDIALTEEVSGNNTYTSENVAGLGNDAKNVTALTSKNSLSANGNEYLEKIIEKDFAKYPFNADAKTVLLLSANGAAYTAKLPEITLGKDERILLSFWVKTSEIMNGRTGAGATLVDGENKTSISAFDSTTLAGLDIGDDKDVYDGWTQCFFFVSNDTDEAKPFHIELTYGPASIVGTDRYDYGQGYAAFTNFEAKSLSKAELSYASSGDRTATVSLTGKVADSTVFDAVSAASDIKSGLALPANFTGIVAGSKNLVAGGGENAVPETVYTGLLNSQYAKDYTGADASEETKALVAALGGSGTGDAWWNSVFGDANISGAAARQPLVIVNAGATATPSYGYFAETSTVSANSYQKISLRVKLSEGAKAFVYLTDASDVKKGFDTPLSANAPKITYWYDDDGNICSGDPAEKTSEILFYLADNGLYTNAKENDGKYYANLYNYTQEDGNLVTKEGTVAFYGKEEDGAAVYYAYYDEDTDEYSQPVECLPATHARYNYAGKNFTQGAFASVIEIAGTAENADKWLDVAFYVHTGNAEQTFRLEVFAGARTDAMEGIPAGGYVFFDRYSSSSTSNYEAILTEAVNQLKGDTIAPDENLGEDVALYYTFTFYDSASYTRYDATLDQDELGNPYGSYKQSAYDEQLIALHYTDSDGKLTGSPANMLFLDYSATDVTVEQDDLGGSGDSGDDDDTAKEPISTGDILLIVSGSLLGVVLIFAIVAIAVRRGLAKRRKTAKVRTRKPARARNIKIVADDEEE